MPMMQQAIQDSACDDLVLGEYLRPGFESTVRRQDDGALLVEAGNRLEEQVGPYSIQLQIPQFIQNEQIEACDLHHFGWVHSRRERLYKLVHELVDRGEGDALSGGAGFDTPGATPVYPSPSPP